MPERPPTKWTLVRRARAERVRDAGRRAVSGAVLPLVVIACLGGGPALAQAGTPDVDDLRRQWHRCVRQSFSGQAASIEKHAAQRAALVACKPSEDAYVAAELAARQAEGEARYKPGLTTRARAFMASVASSVVDPVASWFGELVR